MKLLNRFLLLVIVIVAVAGIWMLRDMFQPTPFEVKYELKQIEAFAAAARADAQGESPDKRGVAQNFIIDTMMRYIEKHPKVTPIDILENALTLYPEGWAYEKTFWGRGVFAIKNSWFYPGSSWAEAYKRAIDALKRGPADGCSTHYVRAKRGYGAFTNETEAAKELLRTMEKDPHQPRGLRIIFLCPKA